MVEKFYEIGSQVPKNPYDSNIDPRYPAMKEMRCKLKRDGDEVSKISLGKAVHRIISKSKIKTVEELASASPLTMAHIKRDCTPKLKSTIDTLRERAISSLEPKILR